MNRKSVEFIDTHCHIQFEDYPITQKEVIASAVSNGVVSMIAVGCTLQDSKEAVEIAGRNKTVWASIGLHPHEATGYIRDHQALNQFKALASRKRVVAIGETGLDYFYEHSPPEDQTIILRLQLELAIEYDLPLIFHVRSAFDDFWAIVDEYKGLRGVVHSFSSDRGDLEQILTRGLYVGLNGIMTFSKNKEQLEAAKAVPLDKLLLETDAPFLTPVPFRGKICEPKHVRSVGEFLADLRGESLDELAAATTNNAKRLFNIT